jgi:hypothetical protein
METYLDQRTIPVIDAADVLVVGGGSAGIMSALAAARLGCKVLLIDPSSAPGGTSAIGLPLLGYWDGVRRIVGGIPHEFLRRLKARGGLRGDIENGALNYHVDPELVKMVAIEMLSEAGVKMLLHTMAVDTVVKDGRLWGVIVEGKGGRRVLRAKQTIDCSGDADIAAFAGVPFEKSDGELQSPTLMFSVGNIDMEAYEKAGGWDFLMKTYEDVSTRENFRNPRRTSLSCFWYMGMRPNELSMNVTRILDIDATDPDQLTKAEIEGRYQAWEFLDKFLKPHVPGFQNAYISNTFHKVGVRETRRIVGEYVVTRDDIWNFRQFEDRVCCGSYPIDMHGAKDERSYFPAKHFYGGKHYTIPYRALVPLKVEDLLVAGRAISCDHVAFGALRVIGNTMGMGQAAGTAAALAIRDGVTPRKLDIARVLKLRRADGAFLGLETEE